MEESVGHVRRLRVGQAKLLVGAKEYLKQLQFYALGYDE